MSKFWKALGVTAALAALVPVSIKEDKETRKKTYRSLLLSLDVKTDEAAEVQEIGLNIGDGLVSRAIARAVTAKREAELFTDDPAEAVVAEAQAIADEAQAIADEAQVIADEAQDAADEAQAIADEAQAAADAVEEAVEADFDPEF